MGRRKSAAKKMKSTAWMNTKSTNRASGKNPDTTENVAVGQVRDGNGRMIFKNPELCAQFLRDNLDLPFLRNVQPEDIQDVTEKYRAYLGIHFEADSVKKIRLHDMENQELFFVSLIEHKSEVDYNVTMQLLRYMVCIWTECAREMEAKQEGITRTKGFRYPPILPVVYYEGSANWTADMNFRDRIQLQEVFGSYCPNFTYKVVRLHDYTNEELLDREDEMSFLMMVNRVQTSKDLENFLQVEQETVKRIVDKASPQILEIFAETIWSLCVKMNVPLREAEKCVEKVKERNMGYLFANMEKMDIQEERRKTAEARAELKAAKEKAEEAEAKAEEAEAKLKEAEAKTEEIKAKAEEMKAEARAEAENQTEKMRNEAIKNTILLCRKFGTSKETAVQELIELYGMDRAAAQEKAELHWESI